MNAAEIEAAGGKKTISELLEEAELLPGVWGRLYAYETTYGGWHVMQDDPDGGRAVADCDTMEIAKFLVCAPKAIVGLKQALKKTKARAEAAEARVKELDAMLDMLPEYLEYWDACDGPALSLSEWWVCKKSGYL